MQVAWTGRFLDDETRISYKDYFTIHIWFSLSGSDVSMTILFIAQAQVT